MHSKNTHFVCSWLDDGHDPHLAIDRNKDPQLRWFAPLSGDGVFFVFGVFVDLINEQIERRMLIIPLSRGSQLHRHTEAIGVVV